MERKTDGTWEAAVIVLRLRKNNSLAMQPFSMLGTSWVHPLGRGSSNGAKVSFLRSKKIRKVDVSQFIHNGTNDSDEIEIKLSPS